MVCPICRVDLERKRAKDGATELDRCPRCEGIWFDDGEIAAVIGARSVSHLTIPDNAVEKEKQLCPRCSKPLRLFTYPGTVTVIEGCKTCRGLWLDAGEIQTIAKMRGEKRMTCPSCGHQQLAAETCTECGIVVAKYSADRQPRLRNTAEAQSTPGIKGSLIRFIDDSLDRVWTGIKG